MARCGYFEAELSYYSVSFSSYLPSLEPVSVKCSSKNKAFQLCAGSLHSSIGLLEPAYFVSEASNLALGSSQTDTELMYSFKIC